MPFKSFQVGYLPLFVEIRCSNLGGQCRGRRFRFEKIWLQEEGCEFVIQNVWALPSRGPRYSRYVRIRDTHVALLDWQHKVEIEKVREKLGVTFDQPSSNELRMYRE